MTEGNPDSMPRVDDVFTGIYLADTKNKPSKTVKKQLGNLSGTITKPVKKKEKKEKKEKPKPSSNAKKKLGNLSGTVTKPVKKKEKKEKEKKMSDAEFEKILKDIDDKIKNPESFTKWAESKEANSKVKIFVSLGVLIEEIKRAGFKRIFFGVLIGDVEVLLKRKDLTDKQRKTFNERIKKLNKLKVNKEQMSSADFDRFVALLDKGVKNPDKYVFPSEKNANGHRQRFVAELILEINDLLGTRVLDKKQKMILNDRVKAFTTVFEMLKVVKGENPMHVEPVAQATKDFFDSPLFSFEFIGNYWADMSTIANYAADTLDSIWGRKAKTCRSSIACETIHQNLKTFDAKGEPTTFDGIRKIIAKEWEDVRNDNKFPNKYPDPVVFLDDITSDYFLAIMFKELFKMAEFEKKTPLNAPGRKAIMTAALKLKFPITAYPSLYDDNVCFGAYQTIIGTHSFIKDFVPKKLSSSKDGHIEEKEFVLNNFENCLTFECQTRAAAWLTRHNLSTLESYLFGDDNHANSETKDNIRSLLERNPKDRKKLLYRCLAALHNGMNLELLAPVLSVKYKKFEDFSKALADKVDSINSYGIYAAKIAPSFRQ